MPALDPLTLAALVTAPYENRVLAAVDDHVIRMSVMTEPFHWHRHPGADEAFLVLEGTVELRTPDERVELRPGELFTVPAGVPHVTAPLTERTVNLTVERADMPTERVDAPPVPR